jgi:hypothetical protein
MKVLFAFGMSIPPAGGPLTPESPQPPMARKSTSSEDRRFSIGKRCMQENTLSLRK